MKSQLQQAADDVREMKLSVEATERAEALCLRDVAKAKQKVEAAQAELRKEETMLYDTRDMLNARRNKLNRALHAAGAVVQKGHGTVWGDPGANAAYAVEAVPFP